jgi:hypothetical protein
VRDLSIAAKGDGIPLGNPYIESGSQQYIITKVLRDATKVTYGGLADDIKSL